MLEQIHPEATKAKDDRYYNMDTSVRDLARRKNFEKFWEQGAHVKLDTLNQCEKVLLVVKKNSAKFFFKSNFSSILVLLG